MKIEEYQFQFISWLQHQKPTFWYPTNISEVLGICKRCVHFFCWLWIFDWKSL